MKQSGFKEPHPPLPRVLQGFGSFEANASPSWHLFYRDYSQEQHYIDTLRSKGSAGIEPSNLIVNPVTADGLPKRCPHCGEVCTEYIGEQGCAASVEPMLWHENSSSWILLKERMVMTYLRRTKCIKLFAWPRYCFWGLVLSIILAQFLLMNNGGAAGACESIWYLRLPPNFPSGDLTQPRKAYCDISTPSLLLNDDLLIVLL